MIRLCVGLLRRLRSGGAGWYRPRPAAAGSGAARGAPTALPLRLREGVLYGGLLGEDAPRGFARAPLPSVFTARRAWGWERHCGLQGHGRAGSRGAAARWRCALPRQPPSARVWQRSSTSTCSRVSGARCGRLPHLLSPPSGCANVTSVPSVSGTTFKGSGASPSLGKRQPGLLMLGESGTGEKRSFVRRGVGGREPRLMRPCTRREARAVAGSGSGTDTSTSPRRAAPEAGSGWALPTPGGAG